MDCDRSLSSKVECFRRAMSDLRYNKKELSRRLKAVTVFARMLLEQELELRASTCNEQPCHPDMVELFAASRGLRVELHEMLGLSMAGFDDELGTIESIARSYERPDFWRN